MILFLASMTGYSRMVRRLWHIVRRMKGQSLCDGMLFHGQEWLAFVELKVKKDDWIQHGIDQLASTIKLFCENHDYKAFRHREAYAANRKSPRFFIRIEYK